ncbi:serine/threonine-protein kinase [Sulfuricurvum sp.]|uniref:serine/threonine-protein kinase n=1 Tax=Sulfuricurvum sp. TaxID=2025608 RepID=UPI00261CDDA7|nr:serine/threonine-protein kinase [Sulfuricurvum sp.]MDD2782467.1 serine/threonine-protein kinase [Sulfuricurvum sp.]
MSTTYDDLIKNLELTATPSPMRITKIEKSLNNRYTLGKKIGTGGLSVVYEARDDYSEYYGDDRELAIKLPLEHLSTKSDIDAFMYAEYSHLSRLSHPNIVKVMDFGIDNEINIPYIVLEHMNGKLLSEIPISDWYKSDITKLFYSFLNTIEYLHAKNMVHADINPTNLMILEDRTIRLFDFGISINNNKQHLFELDYKNVKAFNPIYASPEVLEGAIPDQKSDLFSFAVIFFELYTGKLPYNKSAIELYKNTLYSKDLYKIPYHLRDWFKHTLHPDPLKRSVTLSLIMKVHKIFRK